MNSADMNFTASRADGVRCEDDLPGTRAVAGSVGPDLATTPGRLAPSRGDPRRIGTPGAAPNRAP